MLVNRRFDGYVVVLVIAVIGYAAMQPAYRLRESAPAEFMRQARNAPPQKRAAEEKIARAYWKQAVTDIQWRYGYGHRLPSEPPEEFVLSAQEYGPKAADPEVRGHYWTKLQELWFVSDAWQKEYGFNSRIIRRWFEVAGNWIEEQSGRMLG